MRRIVATTEWAYRDRQPWAPMEAEEVARIADALAAAGVEMWIDGGWGVDALLGEQIREHDDLDVVIALADVPAFEIALAGAGYERVAGHAPASFVVVDTEGRQVDAHPVVFDELRGGGVYLMEDGCEWVYPAEGFAGRGRVGGRDVRCLTPEVQVLVHDGYELEEKDYRELFLLLERFGIVLPARYRARALAARTRSPRKENPMPLDEERVREHARSYTDAWCSRDPERVASHFRPGGTIAVNGGEPTQVGEVAEGFISAFPDIQVFMDDVVFKDELAEYHWTFTGTSSETGKPVRISGYEEWTFGDDGLIASSLGHYDQAEYDRQLRHGAPSQ